VALDLAKVVARADSRHETSIRLMTKLGMRSKGVAHSSQVHDRASRYTR